MYQIDLEDDAVQNMLIAYDGVRRYPDMITPFSPPPPKITQNDVALSIVLTDEEMRIETNEKQSDMFIKNSGFASMAAIALLAFGYTTSLEGVTLLATFALAGLAGYQVVWGVAPSLHSPLMAVTNAISGMTAVGGMLLLAQGTSDATTIVPDTPAHWMGAIATTLSFVNIIGGFLITGKMLNLFRRKEDPDDYFGYYGVPAAVLVGGLGGSYLLNANNFDSISGCVSIAAAVCCISAIASLADQKSARTGNILGIAGVSFGMASTAADMSLAGAVPAAFEEVAILGTFGGSVGAALASKVGPTELPQTVAAFHSLVGIAAMAGAAGEVSKNKTFSRLAALLLLCDQPFK